MNSPATHYYGIRSLRSRMIDLFEMEVIPEVSSQYEQGVSENVPGNFLDTESLIDVS